MDKKKKKNKEEIVEDEVMFLKSLIVNPEVINDDMRKEIENRIKELKGELRR